MNSERVIAEWRRAEDCRRAAWLCLQHELYADAIAQAYYAVLHTAKAALARYNVELRTHRALNPLFGRHIVIPGLVERHWGSVIGRLATLRMAAYYNAEVIFSEADAACRLPIGRRIRQSHPRPAHRYRWRRTIAAAAQLMGIARLLDPVGR